MCRSWTVGDAGTDPAAGVGGQGFGDPAVVRPGAALDQAVGLEHLHLAAGGAEVHVGPGRQVAQAERTLVDQAMEQDEARWGDVDPRRPRPDPTWTLRLAPSRNGRARGPLIASNRGPPSPATVRQDT